MRDHILGQEWTCRVYQEGAVIQQSTLDLTKMNAAGDLKGGSETFIDGTTRKIDASVTAVGMHLQLTVTAENKDMYKGILVLQVLGDTFMVVAGKLHLFEEDPEAGPRAKGGAQAELAAMLLDQDDPPVVITKP